jgi:hypothetical protein
MGLKWPPAVVNGGSHFGTAWSGWRVRRGQTVHVESDGDAATLAGEIIAIPTDAPLASFQLHMCHLGRHGGSHE